ncbi:ethanolaminephosphotransferase 1-like isoform X1 [Euwallacea fornicatus]|uniref:ethanolaminephosphotransferase 1-like isoform X1 n=3 Tax=Euwallacea fornicatus TaxID=995702 RepID=UPI00338EEEAE
MFLEREYLSPEQLNGFDNYKYNCKDTGLLSIYVMHPFWNWVVQYCPKNIAPNLLTFTGFLCTIGMYLMLMVMDYDFTASDPDHPEVAPLPRWVWFMAGLLLFVGYTLDGIDGKQARRTGTSGPLGELFDHGLDSYTAGLIPATMYSIFGRGSHYSVPPFRMFFTMCNVLVNFYLSHFEKYNTGVMFLPWGYDFTMCGMIITFLITSLFGSDLWQYSIFGITNGMFVEGTLYFFSAITNWPIVLHNIYKSYKDGTGHMRSFPEAIRPLIPLILCYYITYLWMAWSPSNIIEKDPRALFFLMGTIFSNISCRLIVAQMSSTRCDWFSPMFLPMLLAIAVTAVTKLAWLELFLLYALCFGTSLAHIHYGTCLVRQMCRHFKINCFTIKKRSD